MTYSIPIFCTNSMNFGLWKHTRQNSSSSNTSVETKGQNRTYSCSAVLDVCAQTENICIRVLRRYIFVYLSLLLTERFLGYTIFNHRSSLCPRVRLGLPNSWTALVVGIVTCFALAMDVVKSPEDLSLLIRCYPLEKPIPLPPGIVTRSPVSGISPFQQALTSSSGRSLPSPGWRSHASNCSMKLVVSDRWWFGSQENIQDNSISINFISISYHLMYLAYQNRQSIESITIVKLLNHVKPAWNCTKKLAIA